MSERSFTPDCPTLDQIKENAREILEKQRRLDGEAPIFKVLRSIGAIPRIIFEQLPVIRTPDDTDRSRWGA